MTVYRELDHEIKSFQQWSGLGCPAGCGKCCYKSDLEATTLEFIPFAYEIYLRGEAELWLEKIKATPTPFCVLLKPFLEAGDKGLCTDYMYRGLICRLFGYATRLDKYNKKQLVTCQTIKAEQHTNYQLAQDKITSGVGDVPVMTHFYRRLHSIDPYLTEKFYPVNIAIRKALEEVLHYHAYRDSA